MSERDNNQNEPLKRPSVGRLSVPVWIFVVALLLGYRGCMHIDQSGGAFAFNAQVYGPYRSPEELDNLKPTTIGIEAAIKKGRVFYSAACMACHQQNGLGMAGAFPPLAGSEWVLEEGHERVTRIVLHGLIGPITVANKQFNSQMPPFPTFSDNDIANVLTYIKNAKEWGNATGEWVTPEHVAAIRNATGNRSKQWTAAELQAIANK